MGRQHRAASGHERAVPERSWVLSGSTGLILLTSVVIFASVHGAGTLLYLAFRFPAELDPVAEAISYYAYVDGARVRFTVALLEMALAGAALTLALLKAGALRRTAALVLMNSWCAGVVLVALFPTDDDPRILSVSGVIHQVAGASLFVTLPLAVLLALREPSGAVRARGVATTLRRAAIATLALALAYLTARLPDIAPGWPLVSAIGNVAVGGLLQRALFAGELVLLLVLAGWLFAVTRSGAPLDGDGAGDPAGRDG
ncbi:DUF998 domain-containing protein [Haloechinothrix sp. YIM 98757]|uniref:DUF998 domain-containing protein n=1 Tax=Haloechinothrix aidingensis TaxID=2752311 RepID=A0A838A9T9_9PSEU|nr:DUF998 domain-containing protein [Haloechinothrix aidingensis]MBA0125639.1 DUF998 domain-containing protein [Haloechinothrix aidingensis]